MGVSTDTVKLLREKTGAGIMDCKKALAESKGDIDLAVEWLRRKGIARSAKFAEKKAAEGVVHAYIHPGGRIGVIVEVNCETDFVARTDDFKNLVNDLALQIAATAPLGLSREDVPKDLVDKEKDIYRSMALAEGKPEKVLDKIIDGRLEKYYEEACLLDQVFVKDQDKKVGDLVKELSGKVGENIVVRRFARFQLGEAS
ncbi:MAG TPA: translation elongation factor Ts [bacterium]|nr:translation elongation factor Ts [bacterium]